jgi:hypothetical protein
MRSAVLFLIFNRPKKTRATFACIRAARPPRLYVAADGPRPDRADDEIFCKEARAVTEQVDWPCDVHTLFRKSNLGCGVAVSSAVSWFFQHEAEGVILEDDLFIHPDFFVFCDILLEKYRSAENIMHIGGNNFQFGLQRGTASYYFSCLGHCWGWASWARAWAKYDHSMSGLRKVVSEKVPELFQSGAVREHYQQVFSMTKNGRIDTWAYRWLFSRWKNNGLAANPNVNLVRNIGFSDEATHTRNASCVPAHMEVEALHGPITHPSEISRDAEADEWTASSVLARPGALKYVFLEEAVARLTLRGATKAFWNLAEILRATFGEFPELLQLEAIAFMRDGRYVEALSCAVKFFEAEPESPEARNLVGMIKAALSGKKISLTR